MNYGYPINSKQFRAAKIPIKKQRYFFLAPNSASFNIGQ